RSAREAAEREEIERAIAEEVERQGRRPPGEAPEPSRDALVGAEEAAGGQARRVDMFEPMTQADVARRRSEPAAEAAAIAEERARQEALERLARIRPREPRPGELVDPTGRPLTPEERADVETLRGEQPPTPPPEAPPPAAPARPRPPRGPAAPARPRPPRGPAGPEAEPEVQTLRGEEPAEPPAAARPAEEAGRLTPEEQAAIRSRDAKDLAHAIERAGSRGELIVAASNIASSKATAAEKDILGALVQRRLQAMGGPPQPRAEVQTLR